MVKVMRECQEGYLCVSEFSIVKVTLFGDQASNNYDIAQKIVLIDVL